MKDKLLDIYYFIKDKVEELIWFIQDNVKTTLGLIGVVGFLALVFFMLSVDDKNQMTESGQLEENSVEQIAYMETESEVLKDVFSELQVMDFSIDSHPVLEISLYLKQPFIESSDLEQHLDSYLELLKLKYNDTEEDVKIRAVRINLYDRQLLFENDLPANGVYTYMWSSENVEEETEDPYATMNQGMTTLAWDQTTESKEEPDYSKYRTYFEFTELKEDPSVAILSDEEFEWFLKLEQYMALTGGVESGAKLYLQWDLGANLDALSTIAIEDSFQMFVDRLSAIEARTNYYSEDPQRLRMDLVITNPQFLLFADHEEIIEDPMEARGRLIEIDSSLYTRPVESWIETQAENYSDVEDPASLDNPENKTNTQLIEDGELETQEEEILEQSSDSESTEESKEPESTESTEEESTEDSKNEETVE